MLKDKRILGKYEIIKQESPFLIGSYNGCDYRIEIFSKTQTSDRYSEIAKNINSISHKNISNLKIEEDDKNFYFIDKDFGEGYSDLKAEWFGKNYDSLIRCYLQIINAVDFIHQKGFFHGNINPKKIIVDRNDNAYLLDFGRCYIYAMMSDKPSTQFYAPEQIIKNECCKESDIYSLGLCMVNLLIESQFDSFVFLEEYKDFNSLEKIYEKIVEEEEEKLDNINADLLLLIKKMLKELPEERINLIEIKKELQSLLNKISPSKIFAIKIYDEVIKKYREVHNCERYEEKEHIQKQICGYRAYWEFGVDANNREVIRISIGNIVFCCSAEPQDSFFCFSIIENPRITDKLQQCGLLTDDKFDIFLHNENPSGYDTASEAIYELKKKYEQKKLKDEYLEMDKTSIKTEEELLKAEKKTIDEKKNTRKVILIEINRGKNTLKFQFIPEKNNDKDKEIETLNNKDFKQNQKIIIRDKYRIYELKGIILEQIAGEYVVVECEKYAVNDKQNLKKDEEYILSYDYQIEEILWSKRNRALEELQNGNALIQNFLRKINRPQEFIKNDLIDIKKFFNKQLDENQKLAVFKSLSLNIDCEILVLQGPPGTGKTTTITEIVTQILKTRPNERILVASQSNQAVDNVLEKVCNDENKICRIGNDLEKLSAIAQNFTPDKVLNKIIKDNIERIDKNPIKHENPKIQAEMVKLQKDFRERLQHITSKMGIYGNTTQKNKKSNLADLFYRNIRLLFGTLIGISSWNNFRERYFDTVIVDEAGRATLSELLVPCIKAKKLILVGDHKQLAPIIEDDVIEKINDKQEAQISFFQRLFERFEKADRENLWHTLEYNYRAERRICDLYSNIFYDGRLKTTDKVNDKKQHLLSFKSSVVWYDTGKFDNKEDKQKGTGKINMCNVNVIEKILNQLENEMKSNKIDYNIGIITPYKAQMELLKDKLAIKKNFKYKIDIGTVDSFQGSDRDIIIYDCVRSGKLKQRAKIDFIADEKRLNVSLSRAKRLLIIVGDMDFLYKAQVYGNNPFVNIIKYIARNKNSYDVIKEKLNGRK